MSNNKGGTRNITIRIDIVAFVHHKQRHLADLHVTIAREPTSLPSNAPLAAERHSALDHSDQEILAVSGSACPGGADILRFQRKH